MAKSAQKIKSFTDSEGWGEHFYTKKPPRTKALHTAQDRNFKKWARKTREFMNLKQRRRKAKREKFHAKEEELWS